MRVSEFGRWFRFLSVVSLMLCGFSINLLATPSITTAPTSQAVPAGADVTGPNSVVTFTGAGSSSAYSTVNYTWDYWDGVAGSWVPIVPGAGVGIFQGATVAITPANTNPQTVANGTTSTLKISNVPTSAGGLLIEFVVSDASAPSSTNPANSSAVTLTVGTTWAADGTLPSGAETFERLTLLANNGPLIAIGGNNPENNAGVTTINVDAHPGVTAAPSGPETWTAAAQTLPYPLVRPTSTLLPNGTVLIAGGLNGATDSAAAWIYTYGTSLTSTGSLTTARDGHTASLLPNGLVLAAGGNNNGQILNSAELYNPATGTWSAAQPLNVARYDHAATILADGRVLITGGFNALGPISSAEIYDPIQNTWTATASTLTIARAYHTATLLPNGDVLIAGGINSVGTPVNSAEIFNPTLGTFSALPATMVTARDQGTATLTAAGNVLIAGGFTSSGATAASEYFSTTTDLFTATQPLITPRDADAAVLVPSGDVVVAGGTGTGGASVASAEKFWDPAQLTAPTPSAAITVANNAVAGQYLAATCGGSNTPNSGIHYAWTVVDGQTLTLPAGGSALYPNYVLGANGIYTGDTSTIEFMIPTTETGRTLQLSCLATSSLGISAQSSVNSANIAPGITGGIIPITHIFNNVSSPPFAATATILQGGSITFNAFAFGAPTLYDYQWQYFNPSQGWKNFPAAGGSGFTSGTAESLTISPATTGEDGLLVQVIVTNAAGSAPSINQQTLYVVAQPQSVAATCAGTVGLAANCTITSTANNPGPAYKYGAPGPAILTASYAPFTPPTQGGIGATTNTVTYQWCTTSNSASPKLATPTSCTGTGIASVGGATAKTYSANPNAGGVYYYYVVVTNTLNGVPNSVASAPVTLTVLSLPTTVTVQNTITTPANVVVTALNSSLTPTVLAGNDITFSTTLTGSPYPTTYTYQWQYFDPIGGWKNWGTASSQLLAPVQGYSDNMQVRVAVTNAVGTVYSDAFLTSPQEVTLFVVLQPTNVVATLQNCPNPGNTSTWTSAPIAQGNNACITATDKSLTGNTTEYTWYEVGDNPIAGGPDLPLNGFVSLSLCDFLGFIPNQYVADTLVINHACLEDSGTYYAVASNFNSDFFTVPPLITSPTTTSNNVQLIVNVGTWTTVTSTNTLNAPRFEAYSLLLPSGATANDFFIGGGLETLGLPPLTNDDIYAPLTTTTGTWTPSGGSTAGYHLNGTATLFNDVVPYILIAGGSDGSSDGQTGLDYYNTATMAYSSSNVSLPLPVTQQVAALLPSQSILLAGGQNGDLNNFYNAAYLFTPGATPGTHDAIVASNGVLSVARAGAASVTLPSGRILITGGKGAAGPVNAVDIYDPWAADWTAGAPSTTLYPTTLYNDASGAHGNLGVGLAGTAGDFFAQAIPTASTALPAPLVNHTATLLKDGRVLIAGGSNASGTVQNTLIIWDPAANSGAGGFYGLGTATPGGAVVPNPVAGTLLTARQNHQAVLLENGDVLIFGGTSSTGAALKSAEIVNPNWVLPICALYTPQCPTAPTTLNASQPASNLNYARTLASSSLLQNGSALAVGGYNGAALVVADATEVFNGLEGFSTPTPSSDGTLSTVPYVAGPPPAPPIQAAFTPAAGVEITNYSWSVNAPLLTVVSGQGTSAFSFNTNAQGHFTVSLLTTDEWGFVETCSVALTVDPIGWTWGIPSCTY
jgi:hypothetical protein